MSLDSVICFHYLHHLYRTFSRPLPIPHCAVYITTGLIKIINSVIASLLLTPLKKFPIKGRSPRNGTFALVWLLVSTVVPPITTICLSIQLINLLLFLLFEIGGLIYEISLVSILWLLRNIWPHPLQHKVTKLRAASV